MIPTAWCTMKESTTCSTNIPLMIHSQGNPVLFPTKMLDFRDPKVFWYDESSMWVMVLAVRDRVEFYTSPNLKE